LRSADQAALWERGQALHRDTQTLLAQGRDGLVWGIREAFMACFVLLLISYVLGHRLPAFIDREPARK
jgi:hypothetical protein